MQSSVKNMALFPAFNQPRSQGFLSSRYQKGKKPCERGWLLMYSYDEYMFLQYHVCT